MTLYTMPQRVGKEKNMYILNFTIYKGIEVKRSHAGYKEDRKGSKVEKKEVIHQFIFHVMFSFSEFEK